MATTTNAATTSTTAQQPQRKPYIEAMHVIRSVAMIGVLIVHSTSVAIADLAPGSTGQSVYAALNTMFRFGTPMFLFLSAFVLFYNYWDRQINLKFLARFYGKRVTFIILPYLMISIFYFLAKAYLFYGMPDWSAIQTFLFQLAVGKAHFHLYFIFVIIQFYLAFPLVMLLLQRFPGLVKHVLWIGFGLHWVFIWLNSQYLQIPYKGSVMFSYLIFYAGGIFVAFYLDRIKQFLTITRDKLKKPAYGAGYMALYAGALISVGGHVYIWLANYQGNGFHSMWYELFWQLQNICIITLLMQFFLAVYPKLDRRLQGFFQFVANTSFGVYLLHPFFLMLYEKLPKSGNILAYHAQTFGKFLFIWLMPCLAIALLLLVFGRYHWIFIGKNSLKTTSHEK